MRIPKLFEAILNRSVRRRMKRARSGEPDAKKTLLISVMCLRIWAAQGAERIWLGQINGRPVRLIFDSAVNRMVLFPEAAKRLGLKVTEAPPGTMPGPGEVVGGATEDCTLSLGGAAARVNFAVVNMPAFVRLEEDGALGWGPVSSNIFLIDTRKDDRRVLFLLISAGLTSGKRPVASASPDD
jgi:hypothetical protein